MAIFPGENGENGDFTRENGDFTREMVILLGMSW
jgi:hypothetical protein